MFRTLLACMFLISICTTAQAEGPDQSFFPWRIEYVDKNYPQGNTKIVETEVSFKSDDIICRFVPERATVTSNGGFIQEAYLFCMHLPTRISVTMFGTCAVGTGAEDSDGPLNIALVAPPKNIGDQRAGVSILAYCITKNGDSGAMKKPKDKPKL